MNLTNTVVRSGGWADDQCMETNTPAELDARSTAANSELPEGYALTYAYLLRPTPTAQVEWVLTGPDGFVDYFLHEDDALADLAAWA